MNPLYIRNVLLRSLAILLCGLWSATVYADEPVNPAITSEFVQPNTAPGDVPPSTPANTVPRSSRFLPVERPAYYPSRFKQVGILGSKLAGRNVIISGIRYYYGVNTKFYTPKSRFASINAFNPGSHLGFTFNTDKEGRSFLQEVWLLPRTMTDNRILDR